jgi:hypothetical protein
LHATETLHFIDAAYCTSGVEFEGFPRHSKQLVHHAQEVPDGEHHVNQAAIFGVDHQFVALAQILIPVIDHRPGSGRLKTAPPRPVVSSATAEEHNQ